MLYRTICRKCLVIDLAHVTALQDCDTDRVPMSEKRILLSRFAGRQADIHLAEHQHALLRGR